MSNRWPGGVITKTPVTPTGPLQNGTAPGMWSMADAAYWIKQGLWPTAGNFLAVEDVFSTYLYTGNGSTQTITNNLNISGQGGMVWIKGRSGATDHALYDTARGATFDLASNTTAAQTTQSTGLTSFSTTGFSISSLAKLNTNNATYASWTFREAPKFFDVVTWSGNDVNGRSISHSLGVAPGTIIVKKVNAASAWVVYHRSLGSSSGYPNYMLLQTTDAQYNGTSQVWNSAPTATSFSVGNASEVNESGGTYVAYLFAHDTTSDGIIQCGSFTSDSGGSVSVNLGWEPQWVLYKASSTTSNWRMIDNMRGFPVSTTIPFLSANLSNAEATASLLSPTATGFTTSEVGSLPANTTYVYIAIRRGPMRTPTSGTSVFSPVARTGTGATETITSPGFPVDLSITEARSSAFGAIWFDRLRGANVSMRSYQTDGDFTYTNGVTSFASNTGVTLGADAGGYVNLSGTTYANWFFRRAPSFFDEVCYTGTGVARTVNHNLGVAPELMIVKGRNNTTNWIVYSSATAATNYLVLDLTNASTAWSSAWNNTAPTSSVFTVGDAAATNANGINLVAYLFASCPGVSKVGSYTGTGTTQTINCGFTTGARFVLIKRTDSTGDWYVWDSARGIVSGNDPYLLLNSTAAEVTSTDYIDTDNSGFQISSTAPAAINANGGSYIFLAVS